MSEVLSTHPRALHQWYAAQHIKRDAQAGNLAETALPQAVALLAEVLARVSEVELPIMQFTAACPLSDALFIAREFAIASVTHFGRTLLLAESRDSAYGEQMFRNGRSPIVPDGSVAGLYHRRIESETFEPSQLSPPTIQSVEKAFRMMVVVSAAPITAPVSLEQAALCHGSILIVAAGITRLSMLQLASRQIHCVGGTVIGTVLSDAPRMRYGLRWPA